MRKRKKANGSPKELKSKAKGGKQKKAAKIKYGFFDKYVFDFIRIQTYPQDGGRHAAYHRVPQKECRRYDRLYEHRFQA